MEKHGVRKMLPACEHNPGVVCREEGRRCAECGWNAAVARKRNERRVVLVERYRISCCEEIDGPMQVELCDSFSEVVEWIEANGNSMKQISVVREEVPWKVKR